MPTISDWIKVFEVAKPIDLSARSHSPPLGSRSERIQRNVNNNEVEVLQPSKPNTARTARSQLSSNRGHRTPRTAKEIVKTTASMLTSYNSVKLEQTKCDC